MARRSRIRGFGWTLTAALIAAAMSNGCSDEASKPATPGASNTRPAPAATAPPKPARELSVEERIEAGRIAYNANCIACHSLDPTKDGALGPAVSGASLELLEARVLRAEYPEGYTPKRNTRVMVALPHLEPKIPALAAYLASLE